MSALWPIQKALVAQMVANTSLAAAVTGIYDGMAPEDTAMPYVVVGEPSEDSFDALGTHGYNATFVIHVWSNQRGTSREAFLIGDLVDAALAPRLTIAGHGSGITRKGEREMLIEDDGTRHLAIRYLFRAMEAP